MEPRFGSERIEINEYHVILFAILSVICTTVDYSAFHKYKKPNNEKPKSVYRNFKHYFYNII